MAFISPFPYEVKGRGRVGSSPMFPNSTPALPFIRGMCVLLQPQLLIILHFVIVIHEKVVFLQPIHV